MSRIWNLVRAFGKDRYGATAVEYGIMVALIAVVIIITVALMGSALNTIFAAVEVCVGSAWQGAVNCN